MIYALSNGTVMAYVEASSPEQARALVLHAVGGDWSREKITVDVLLTGTVIVTTPEKNKD